jgi:hypothetical protein
MSITKTNNQYAGKFLSDLSTAVLFDQSSYQAGLFRTVEGYGLSAIVQLWDTAAAFTNTPGCSTATDTSATLTNLVVALKRYDYNKTLCKRDLIGTSYEGYMRPGVFNKSIDPAVIEAHLLSIGSDFAENLEAIRWSGDTTSLDATLALQDGIIKLLTTAGGFIPSGNTDDATDPTKVLGVLQSMFILAKNAKLVKKGFKILVAPKVAEAYRQAIIATTSNSIAINSLTFDVMNVKQFATYSNTGIPMVEVYGMGEAAANEGCIIMGIFTTGINSNLVLATDKYTDEANISVFDLQSINPNEDKISIRWGFANGAQIIRPAEVVYHNV